MVWQNARKIPKKIRQALSKYNDLEAQLLFNRGITSGKAAQMYFDPKLTDISAASTLPNVEKAAAIIVDAILKKKKIFIYGDYDADGICSTSILFDFLFRKLKANVLPYIPDRFDEGYGLSPIGLDHILKEKGELVVTVDCGIRDKELVEKYTKKGLDFVITDHHSFMLDGQGKPDLPASALAIVHPQIGKYEFPYICATVVVWKLVQVMSEYVKSKKLINKIDPEIKDQKDKPGLREELLDTEEYLDLVSLATVCDLMPLERENRSIVAAGLEAIRNNKINRGLLELLKLSQVEQATIDSYHFGFILGPRLNAAGRMDHGLNGVRLFTSKDPQKINIMAMHLHSLNFKRQELTEKMLAEGMIEAERQIAENKKLIFVVKEGWSEGIVGLVAGRLNEKFYLPVLAASSKNGLVRGSARSIKGFDITAAISKSSELLSKFGGHNQAAGFSLQEKDLPAFIEKMQQEAEKELTSAMTLKALEIESEITGKEIDLDFVESLKKFKPFGFGNAEPIFAVMNIFITEAPTLMGSHAQHIKFTAMTPDDLQIEAIAFNQAKRYSDIIDLNKKYDIAGTLGINEWRGNKIIQLRLKDLVVRI